MSEENKLKIMITGTHGFVGARAMQHYPTAISVPGELLRNAGEPLIHFINTHSPDIILNAAAISDIGTCEKNPESSYAANVVLPVMLAKTSKEVGAKLISFSSDQVYTGCVNEGPYSEKEVLPAPMNLYARHKLEAEQRVLEILPEAVMLRATWMYDMPVYSGVNGSGHINRGNFLINTLRASLHGREMNFSSQEYRGITYVRQAVSLLDQVFELPGGIYNYGSENSLNMLETAKALLLALGLKGQVQDMERRRHNLWMDCKKLREQGILFDTTEEGFRRCVDDYGLRPFEA